MAGVSIGGALVGARRITAAWLVGDAIVRASIADAVVWRAVARLDVEGSAAAGRGAFIAMGMLSNGGRLLAWGDAEGSKIASSVAVVVTAVLAAINVASGAVSRLVIMVVASEASTGLANVAVIAVSSIDGKWLLVGACIIALEFGDPQNMRPIAEMMVLLAFDESTASVKALDELSSVDAFERYDDPS
jgi:hypothetical protein